MRGYFGRHFQIMATKVEPAEQTRGDDDSEYEQDNDAKRHPIDRFLDEVSEKYISVEIMPVAAHPGFAEDAGATSRDVSTNAKSIESAMHQPSHILTQLDTRGQRMPTHVLKRAGSFHKKALKVNAVRRLEQSHLKLGTLSCFKIWLLYVVLHVVVLVGPVIQVVYVGFSIGDTNSMLYENMGAGGTWGTAFVQITLLVMAGLFIRRIAQYSKRQHVQVEIMKLAVYVSIACSFALISTMYNAYIPRGDLDSNLRSVAHALLAGFLYLTLARFSDSYADHIHVCITGDTNSQPISQKPQTRLQVALHRLRHHATNPTAFACYVAAYIVLRLVLSWRNTVVFDFLPMTNVVTLLRLKWIYQKELNQSHLLADSVVISFADLFLLTVACYKAHRTKGIFQRVFLQDFARIYTEFSIFVLYLRETILIITSFGHIASWVLQYQDLSQVAIPIVETVNNTTIEIVTINVLQTGAAQLQSAFLWSIVVWLLTIMYCALPCDSVGLCGWFVGTANAASERNHQRIKYFLYASDVYIKATFVNLETIDRLDPTHFIMEKQIEAFNFAQLVYACGSTKQYQDDEGTNLQALVGDPKFTIVALVRDASTDTHCVIAASDSMIVIAFRGTSSKKNAKTDLNAVMTLHHSANQCDLSALPSGLSQSSPASQDNVLYNRLFCKRNAPKVHSGFYAAYESIQERVLGHIKQLNQQYPRHVLVTGHSLGGALAALCSFDLVVQLRITNVTCTTFGCPRVGNHAFAKRFKRVVPATFAFINASDLVTKLPPKTPKAQSYTGVGTVVLLNAFGNLMIDPNVLELRELHAGYSPKAHTLTSYQVALLLWCLRSHGQQYHPRLWRLYRAFLDTNCSHLEEICAYTKEHDRQQSESVIKEPEVVPNSGALTLRPPRSIAQQHGARN